MTAGVAVVAACGSDKPGTVADDGSVTVKHAFGETKIPSPPKRVVSAGFTEQDDLLALGVVPIAVTDWFGGEPFGVWPWAQPKLGRAQPVVLSLADGIQVDQIAALKPDLIVATNAGLDPDTYAKLSAIAPTIAQSGQDAFFEPWKDQATIIGQAVFKADEMSEAHRRRRRQVHQRGQEQPAVHRQEGVVLQGTFAAGQCAVATLPGWRTDFLTQMGFVIPDEHQRLRRRPPRPDPAQRHGLRAQRRRCADLDHRERRGTGRAARRPDVQRLKAPPTSATSSPARNSPAPSRSASLLSYPVVADQLPPLLAQALA